MRERDLRQGDDDGDGYCDYDGEKCDHDNDNDDDNIDDDSDDDDNDDGDNDDDDGDDDGDNWWLVMMIAWW